MSTTTYRDGTRVPATYKGRTAATGDHVGATLGYADKACRASFSGAIGDCVRPVGHDGHHQGAHFESWADNIRGTVDYEATDLERDLLDTLDKARQLANMADGPYAGNRVYGKATDALSAALAETYGSDMSAWIYELILDSGESIAYCLPLARERVADDAATGRCNVGDHDWHRELFNTQIAGDPDSRVLPARECRHCGYLQTLAPVTDERV